MARPDDSLAFDPGGDGVEGRMPSAFDRSLVLPDHARSPEITFALRADDALAALA